MHLTHHGERAGSTPAEPLPTVTGANRGEQAMASAFFEQANGGFYDGDGRPGRRAHFDDHRLGSNQRLVTAYLVWYYSEGGQDSDAPSRYPPSRPRRAWDWWSASRCRPRLLSPEHREKARCAALLHEHLPDTFGEEAELVLMSYNGVWWVLVDITLRMLKARELYRAQSFPGDYVIDEIPDPALLFGDGVRCPATHA